VTHVPFSHTFEDNMEFWGRHDEKERYIELFDSESGEIGKILRREKIEDEVIKLLTVKNPETNLDDPWKSQILTAPICADLLDYLRRDAYFCGLKRSYDDRIFKYFDIQNNRGKDILVLDLTKNDSLRIDALSETLNILRLRCFLTQAIYYHHTKLCADAIVSKALQIAINDKKITRASLSQIGDETFLDTLLKLDDPQISQLILRIKERKLLKRAFIVTANTVSVPKTDRIKIKNKIVTKFLNSVAEKNKMENKIAAEVGIAEEDIIILCVGDESLKESTVCVKLQTPEGITELNRSSLTHEETTRIEHEYLELWKFIVFAPRQHINEVHDICKSEFKLEGETPSSPTSNKEQTTINKWG
jgi:HD superfamily phosphohydrolase